MNIVKKNIIKKYFDKNKESLAPKNVKDRINEIARMLSGKSITNEALLAAKRLLENT